MIKNEKIRNILYYVLLAIICVSSFLTAKYIVRRNIKSGDVPIDTSTRIELE